MERDLGSETGRVLAIGDVHGCARALSLILESVSVERSDTVVLLGDLVDRGPDSRGVLERVMFLEGECRVVLVTGNHEEMMLSGLHGSSRDEWLKWGGRATLDSYGGRVEDIPEDHRQWLSGGVDYFETDHEICIHANLEPGVPLSEQRAEWLRWTHLTGREEAHASGRRIVCGHTPQPIGLPLVTDGWLCIDTLCWAGGFLTCVDLASNEIWQAQESGTVREGLTLADLA